MLSIALPSSACSLSNTGSPSPTGTWFDYARYNTADGIAIQTHGINQLYHLLRSCRIRAAHYIVFGFAQVELCVVRCLDIAHLDET